MREGEKKERMYTHTHVTQNCPPHLPGMRASPPPPAQTFGAHFCPLFFSVGPSVCHCTSRRGSMKPDWHPDLCFLRIRRRKRRQKPAAVHKLLQNIVALVFLVLPTSLNLPLRAQRVQLQLPEGNFPTIIRKMGFDTLVAAKNGANRQK